MFLTLKSADETLAHDNSYEGYQAALSYDSVGFSLFKHQMKDFYCFKLFHSFEVEHTHRPINHIFWILGYSSSCPTWIVERESKNAR